MFTGLVEATGTLRSLRASGRSLRLSLATPDWDLTLGESISVDGVCLTVAERTGNGFEADISRETLERTTLGSRKPGAELNLERSLKLGDRLGGHWVAGHVDAVSVVQSAARVDQSLRLEVSVDPTLGYLIAPKGSVALNGVSLTVNAVYERSFALMLIPHTLAATNLKHVAPGVELNLEVDVLARYVARFQSAPESVRRAIFESTEGPEPFRSVLQRAGFTHD